MHQPTDDLFCCDSAETGKGNVFPDRKRETTIKQNSGPGRGVQIQILASLAVNEIQWPVLPLCRSVLL